MTHRYKRAIALLEKERVPLDIAYGRILVGDLRQRFFVQNFADLLKLKPGDSSLYRLRKRMGRRKEMRVVAAAMNALERDHILCLRVAGSCLYQLVRERLDRQGGTGWDALVAAVEEHPDLAAMYDAGQPSEQGVIDVLVSMRSDSTEREVTKAA